MIPVVPEPAVAWVTRSARDRFAAAVDVPIVETGTLPEGVATLVACGGGTLIDAAKAAAKRRPDPLVLVAVPSLWGAGAEASPVVVLGTEITLDPTQLPDHVVLWPQLIDSVPADLRRWGAADVWAHTLEAMASPLGTPELRAELTAIAGELDGLHPVDGDARTWLALSGRACAAQARAGVGVAHGIAHVLASHTPGWGHARLVAAVLPAVGRRLATEAPRWRDADLDAASRAAQLDALTTPADTRAVFDDLAEHWPAVLRDPCTRTNGYLVRRGELDSLRTAAAGTAR
ncbi:MAG: 1-propanol dehydrogenase [Solirubrobacteraceae bacterium]|nr:1-propanol dehydrogenase [Solirubrobacteraceae bacterium]